jgi:N-acetylmuramoyl-L-alanine amidase
MRTLGCIALLVAASSAVARPSHAQTVVLDPGHGGSNVGAPGPDGIWEKRVTLSVSRKLRRELERRGLSVVMTRERDLYLTLGERVRRVNSAHADLFLSLHANASPQHSRRGVETFVAARDVADVAADRAAATANDPVAGMLARARARFVTAESSRLARAVQAALGATRESDRGVRQAPYDVLDGVSIPAALVEVGFLDHQDEGRELLDPEVQQQIAVAIADGIAAFLAHEGGTLARR